MYKYVDLSTGMAKLAQRLGFLPLALVQAGTYMRGTGTSCSEYLDFYETSWSQLVATSPPLQDYQNGSIQNTWMISYAHIQKVSTTAAEFLQLWAYLDHQDVWFELISRGSGRCRDYEWLQDLGQSEVHFKRTMKALVAYSMVESRHTESYSMHPVVHDWCTKIIGKGRDDLVTAALIIVGTAVPYISEAEYWLSQRRLLPHADRCIRQIDDSNNLSRLESVECYDAFHRLGLLYADQGKLAEAESMHQRALAGYEKALGPEHTSTLDTINNLSLLYSDQGKLAEAESMYQRALAGYEKALGPDYPSTFNTINNLGNLYRIQGKLVEAERMYQRALAGKEKAYGRDHTLTLDTVNNLGNFYSDQGKLAEAEKMYRRALDGYEKARGPDHVTTPGPPPTNFPSNFSSGGGKMIMGGTFNTGGGPMSF